MEAIKRVSAARRSLVLDHPFFGVLSLKLAIIEDNAVNFTKFAALSRSPDRDRELVRQPLAGKSSIILTTGHQPGALYEALGVFVSHKINLTKLQSRPIPGEKWHYRFYLDFEADADETMQIIKGLESLDNNVVFLGNY